VKTFDNPLFFKDFIACSGFPKQGKFSPRHYRAQAKIQLPTSLNKSDAEISRAGEVSGEGLKAWMRVILPYLKY